MIKEKINYLKEKKDTPCVTISMNTHRTHPENLRDIIQLKNFCKEAEVQLLDDYGRNSVEPILEKLSKVQQEIDVNYNLDSLHIYLSNNTNEIIRLGWPASYNRVHISDSFVVNPLIKAYNRSEDYFIMLLSQSGVQLFEALNDAIVEEIKNEDFPFPENGLSVPPEQRSDPKKMNNMVREYLNRVDKAIVKIYNETKANVVVICTENNYSRLMQVADRPDIYWGYANIDYNRTAEHQLAAQAWAIAKNMYAERKALAIAEMKKAADQRKVLTDLEEIVVAASDGRADLLIVHQDFFESVPLKRHGMFEVIYEIISTIASDVMSKNGRTFFTENNEIKQLGDIVMKVRY